MDLRGEWLPGPWWLLMVAAVSAVLLMVAAAGAGFLAGRRSRSAATPGPPAPPVQPPPSAPSAAPPPSPSSSPSADSRVAPLVLGLIGAHDLATTNEAVRAHIEQILRRAGVQATDARAGEVFDPDRHAAVGTEPAPADDPAASAGRIARTVRPGWQDGAVIYRVTEVVVWTP